MLCGFGLNTVSRSCRRSEEYEKQEACDSCDRRREMLLNWVCTDSLTVSVDRLGRYRRSLLQLLEKFGFNLQRYLALTWRCFYQFSDIVNVVSTLFLPSRRIMDTSKDTLDSARSQRLQDRWNNANNRSNNVRGRFNSDDHCYSLHRWIAKCV